MKSTGIVRKVDDLGRVVLPIELRRVLKIDEKDPLEIFTDEDSIVLRKYQPSEACVFCGECSGSEGSKVKHFYGKPICHKCVSALVTSVKGGERR